MPLTLGTHLGPYEIVERLGAGGMGEVYRSRDACLGREAGLSKSALIIQVGGGTSTWSLGGRIVG